MTRHFKDLDPEIGALVSEICDEFGLADDAFGHGLPRIEGYPKFPRDPDLRTSAFMQQLSALADGTYIFIDHPAVHSPELAAMGHKGYDDVAADRVSCLETLTSAALRRHIEELGVELISYREL